MSIRWLSVPPETRRKPPFTSSSASTAAFFTTIHPTQETLLNSLLLFNYSKKHPLKGKLAWNLLISDIEIPQRAKIMLMNEFIQQPIIPKKYPLKSILQGIPEKNRQQFIECLCYHSSSEYLQQLFEYLLLEGINILPLNSKTLEWMFITPLNNQQELIEMILNKQKGIQSFYRLKLISDLNSFEHYHKELLQLFQSKVIPEPTNETILIYLRLFKLIQHTSTLLYELMNIFPVSFRSINKRKCNSIIYFNSPSFINKSII